MTPWHLRGRTSDGKIAEREQRVEAAAAEAADSDPAFAADVVLPEAAKLFEAVQAAWSVNDHARLATIVAPALMVEWERRLKDFERKGWQNHVEVIGEPKVDYIGLRNTGNDRDDRVCVLVAATLRDYVVDGSGRHLDRTGSSREVAPMQEYWTLCKREHHWTLESIEQEAEGKHELSEEIIATPWSDERGLRDQALVEGAQADATPAGTDVGELVDVDYEGDARAAANDLSVADGRFAPDVLEVAARRAAAAWADAVDGGEGGLLAVATPEAAEELLHPGDPSGRTRLVVRGPVVKRIQITRLDASAQPPTMTIDVHLSGKRYIENRDTTEIVSGSQSRTSEFTEQWTLSLDGSSEQPWRIAAVGMPGETGRSSS
jgi:predicted lipid-binding transport protein (Tim44 family)